MEESLLELGPCIVNTTCDALSWELGAHRKWDAVGSSGLAVSLLRLPQRWRQMLIKGGQYSRTRTNRGGIREIPDGLMLGCSGVDFEQAKTAAAAGGGAFTSDFARCKDCRSRHHILLPDCQLCGQILSQLPPVFPRYLSTLCTMGEWLLKVLAMHAEANVFV